MRLKTQTSAENIQWESPANIQSSFTAAFKAGMEYHIFKNLSVKAKFFYNSFQHSELQPEYSSSLTPAVSNAQMAPFSAGLGISVSIPWKSDHNKGAPPRRAPPPSPEGPAPPEPDDQQTNQRDEQTQQQEQELPPMVERPPESTPAQLSFVNPIPAQDIMTSYFGDQRMHEGLDINAEKGDDILAIAQGTVIKEGWSGRYGKRVVVRHPAGFKSIYAHLGSIDVEKGQAVDQGSRLGGAGNSGDSTGAHLHFELLRMDLPINPRRYIIHDWEWWKDEKN
jgi:murein DD-endopeptidase MepM/ murein hydrolase activator NlpD